MLVEKLRGEHMNPIQFQIYQTYHELRKSEKKVADFFLNDTYDIRNLTLKELEERVEVSQPTIIRFVQAIGFPSYKNFCVRLIEARAQGEYHSFSFTPIARGQDVEQLASQITMSAQQAIASIWKHITFSQIQAAAKLLHEAKTIIMLGSNSVYSLQYEWAMRLGALGKRVIFRDNEALQKLEITQMVSGDVACIIEASKQPYNRTVEEGIHQQAAKILNLSMNGMDEIADIVLYYHPVQYLYGETIYAMSPFLTLLDLLYSAIIECDYGHYTNVLNYQYKPVES